MQESGGAGGGGGGAVCQARNRKRMIQSSDVISAASQNTRSQRDRGGKRAGVDRRARIKHL